MRFTPTSIEGAYLVELEPHVDERGSFARAFCDREFAEAGIEFMVVQANLARTNRRGTVRGLHFQIEPREQKLVRCLRGSVFDVIVDMRPTSTSRHRVFHTILDDDDRRALFIPAGVAHGYQTMADDTEFMYLTDQHFVPGLEHGVRYSDPKLAIPWPVEPLGVTDRDASWPLVST
jgi:dTDP-4-dehydrorhamnose 3,5-epimerase